MWFEVKVKYYAISEDCAQEKRSEIWIVDAASCTEAEARTVAEMEAFSGVEVTSVKACASTVVESENEGDGIYCAKIAYTTYDGDSGRERRNVVSYLYPASDILSALEAAEDIGGVDMLKIISVGLSKYAGFIPYGAKL